MKKINDRIIDYLDGQMNSKLRKEFESELQNSIQLEKEFEEYKSLFNSLEIEKSRAIDRDYAESIIPAFRKRIEKNRPFLFYKKLAYSMSVLSLAAVVIILLTLFTAKDENGQSDLFTGDFEQIEIESYIDQISSAELIANYMDYQPEILDSVYKSHFSREIKEDDYAFETLFAINDMNYQELESILSDDEMDFVYNEIINKEFF